MNRFLLIVIILLLLFGFIGFATSLNASISRYSSSLIIAAENLAIIMMLVNGTFFGSRLFKLALFFLGLIILGAAFKILHLEGADMLFLYPFLGLFGVYLIHFMQKKYKQRLDFLKVLLLGNFLMVPPLVFLHLISVNQKATLFLVGHILFAVTFLDFLYTSHKQGLLLDK